MRFISSRLHGLLDYLVGVVMIFAPRLLGFQTGLAEDKIFVVLGVAAIAYSLFTRYEFGLFRVLPFRFHLGLDFVSGVLLIASPVLFGFGDRVWVPHVVFGLIEIAAAVATVPQAALPDPLGGFR